MPFFKNIFRKKSSAQDAQLADSTHEEADSPINEFRKRNGGGLDGMYGNDIDALTGDGFRTEAERQQAMDAIFQRPPINGFKPASPDQIFLNPSANEAAGKPSGVAMDAVTGCGGMTPPSPYSSAYQAQAVHHGQVTNGTNGFGFDPIKKYGINDKVLRHYQNRCFITWNSCALIAGHEFIAPACSVPAEDAIAHGFKVVCTSHEHKSGEKHEASEVDFLKDVKRSIERMNATQLCIKLTTKKRIFGVITAIPVMKVTDADGNEIQGERFDYTQEYDPDKITKNSFKGFAVVEPQWLTYEFDDESSMDPTSLHFYEPTYIVKADGTKVHRSWVIRLINKEVPDILKPTYYFGGLSLTQMIYERMWCADKIANEAPLLAMTKRLLIADGNMDQLIAEPRKASMFFKAINYFRDNWSIFVKKPSAQVQQIDTSLSDLTPLQMAQYQLCAAIAGIPVTKMMKNVPTGLQSTGDYEKDDYDQLLISIQEHDYKPFLDRWLELYCRSNFWENGQQRKDIELSVEFNPIANPKASDKTQQSSQQAQMVSNLVGNGLATVAEGRAILRTTGNTFFDPIAPEVPELLKKMEDAKDPEKQQQMQGGMQGMPGMPGGGEGGMPQQPSPEDIANRQNDQVFQKAIAEVNAANGGGDEGSVFQNALAEVNGGNSESAPSQESQNGDNAPDQQGGETTEQTRNDEVQQ